VESWALTLMKRYRFNKLVSLYLDKEICPEELHELNQELERSEGSRKKFKSAILFNQALRQKEILSEEITSVSVIAFTRYAKWGMSGFAAVSIAVLAFFLIKPMGHKEFAIAKEELVTTPVFMETKAPLKKPVQWNAFQQKLAAISLDDLKGDSISPFPGYIFENKQENFFLQPKSQNGQGMKLTQVDIPLYKQP